MGKGFRSWALGLGLLVQGCGSRSALPDESRAGSGGSGAGGLGGGAASGGSTNAGCASFVLVANNASVSRPVTHLDSFPAFVNPPNDPENVTLVFLRRPDLSTNDLSRLTHVTFSPWAAWPPGSALQSPFSSFESGQLLEVFRVAPSVPGTFAAAIVESDVVQVAPQIDASATGAFATLALLGKKPLFVSAPNDDRFVIGTLSIQRELYVQVADATGGEPVPIATIGCANQDIAAGAVPFANGWLVVHSNGTNAPPAVCQPPDVETAGPPARIDVVKLEKSSLTELRISLSTTNPVEELVVAPHPDGLVFAWIEGNDANAHVLRWARYVAGANAIIGPLTVAPLEEFPRELALTSLGTDSILGYVRGSTGSTLLIKLIDASGSERTSFTLAPFFAFRPSLITPPEQRSVVVAFERDDSVELARLDCAP